MTKKNTETPAFPDVKSWNGNPSALRKKYMRAYIGCFYNVFIGERRDHKLAHMQCVRKFEVYHANVKRSFDAWATENQPPSRFDELAAMGYGIHLGTNVLHFAIDDMDTFIAKTDTMHHLSGITKLNFMVSFRQIQGEIVSTMTLGATHKPLHIDSNPVGITLASHAHFCDSVTPYAKPVAPGVTAHIKKLYLGFSMEDPLYYGWLGVTKGAEDVATVYQSTTTIGGLGTDNMELFLTDGLNLIHKEMARLRDNPPQPEVWFKKSVYNLVIRFALKEIENGTDSQKLNNIIRQFLPEELYNQIAAKIVIKRIMV